MYYRLSVRVLMSHSRQFYSHFRIVIMFSSNGHGFLGWELWYIILYANVQGDFKVVEDKKHRATYQALGDSAEKLQFFAARQIACRLLGSRDYLCQKVCGFLIKQEVALDIMMFSSILLRHFFKSKSSFMYCRRFILF